MADRTRRRRSTYYREREKERLKSRIYASFTLVREWTRKKIKQVVDKAFRRIEERRRIALRKEYAKALAEIRARKYLDKTRHYVYHRNIAINEAVWWSNFFVHLDAYVNYVAEASQAGLAGLPQGLPPLAYEFAHDYYTPLNTRNHHYTQYSMLITDLTYNFVENRMADIFVGHTYEMENLVSPYTRSANLRMFLAEILKELLERKGRRGRHRGRKKGSYVPINYDTYVHTALDAERRPYYGKRLGSVIGCLYSTCRDIAHSQGRPELANRLICTGLFAIIGRKTYLTRKKDYYEKDIYVTDRLRGRFTFRR